MRNTSFICFSPLVYALTYSFLLPSCVILPSSIKRLPSKAIIKYRMTIQVLEMEMEMEVNISASGPCCEVIA